MANRRVLVTGGTRGIGRAIAQRFGKAGAGVHIGGRDPEALEHVLKQLPGISGSAADVTDEDAVDRLVRAAVDHLGGLDTLICSAGVPGPAAAVEDVELEAWRHTLDVDLTGTFLVTKAAVPHIKAAGSGSIVNISSVAGRVGYARRTPYAAAKWAVVGFSKSISIELGPFGINVNCILPGPVAGELQDLVLARIAASTDTSPEEARDARLQHISMRRMVEAEEVAEMALYLCSSAGHGVSGQAISLDGDQTALV